MKSLICIFVLLGAFALLGDPIPGDINGDGVVGIADQVMLTAMHRGQLAKNEAADLNFDGEVDTDDVELLLAHLTSGSPLPELLTTASFAQWEPNPTVSAGGLTVDFNYVSTAATVSLCRLPSVPDFDWDLNGCAMTHPVVVYNLPTYPDVHTVTFTLEVPAEHNDASGTPMLVLGACTKSGHEDEIRWHYQALPVDAAYGLSYADHKLTWTVNTAIGHDSEVPNPRTPYALAVLYSDGHAVPAATAPATRGPDDGFKFQRYDQIPGSKIWKTQHFTIQAWIEVTDAQVLELAHELEDAFAKIGQLGLPQNFPKKWMSAGTVFVNITKNPIAAWYKPWKRVKSETAHCNMPLDVMAPTIDIPQGAMANAQRAETCCHELFHYHQYYYACHFSTLFLDEMSGSWSEYLITEDPDSFIPDNYVLDRAPLNGLAMPGWAESTLSGPCDAGNHGYNLVSFARWLTEIKYPARKYPDKHFWDAVFSSRSYKLGDGVRALKQGIKHMDPTGTLAEDYFEFIHDYIEQVPGVPYINFASRIFVQTSPGNLYGNASYDRFAETGFHSNIKAEADMFRAKNQEHVFTVKNYGGATWRLLFRDFKILPDYSNAVVTFSLPQGTSQSIADFKFFAVLGPNSRELFLTKYDEAVYNTEDNTAQITVPLAILAAVKQGMPYLGIVAVLANDTLEADYKQKLTVRVGYTGPVVANDLVSWTKDYQGAKIMETKSSLKFIPAGDTVFAGAKIHAYDIVNFHYFSAVETSVATKTPPHELLFNITGTVQDIPLEPDQASELFIRMGYGGRLNFEVTKTVDRTNVQKVPYQVCIYDGSRYTPVDPATVTTADLLPDPETRRSRLYLRIPDYDPTCDLYDVRLVLPIHVRDVEADSIGPRDFYLMSLVIYPYKAGDGQ